MESNISHIRADTVLMREPQPSAALYDLLEEIGASGGLDQMLGALDRRLRRLLPFDAMSVYLPQGGRLARAYCSGGASPACAAAARVAETRRPAFNADSGAAHGGSAGFRSTLAIPLDSGTEVVGVLALYSVQSQVFEPADLGALLWIRSELARAVKHASRVDRTELLETGSRAVPVEATEQGKAGTA